MKNRKLFRLETVIFYVEHFNLGIYVLIKNILQKNLEKKCAI
jgi:hypothetical protein